MKKIWVTSLDKEQAAVGSLLATAKRYGLVADGHFWSDDLPKLAWQAALEPISDPAVAVWVIIGSQGETLESVGYGLTLLAMSVAQEREKGPAIIWLDPSGSMTADQLPTPLAGATLLPLADASIGAKLVAKANVATAAPEQPYRLRVHANPGFGIWFETGPVAEAWGGAMFGIEGGEIAFQGVGPAGRLPQKAVLEHPQKGLKLQLGASEFSAWALQNCIDTEQSYYVKLDGAPQRVLFGPYAADDDAEAFILKTGIGA